MAQAQSSGPDDCDPYASYCGPEEPCQWDPSIPADDPSCEQPCSYPTGPDEECSPCEWDPSVPADSDECQPDECEPGASYCETTTTTTEAPTTSSTEAPTTSVAPSSSSSTAPTTAATTTAAPTTASTQPSTTAASGGPVPTPADPTTTQVASQAPVTLPSTGNNTASTLAIAFVLLGLGAVIVGMTRRPDHG